MIRVTCCKCQIEFGLPDDFYHIAKQRADDLTWYCPNGHGQVFRRGETEADKLRRELQRAKQREAEYEDRIREWREQAETESHRARAYKGQVTRLKKRAQAGVCPCCNRTFADLARHMKSKHPDMSTEPDNVVPLRVTSNHG
jgi:hypothetical protein